MTQTNDNSPATSLWRRIAAHLMAFAEAMELSETELHGRRIDAVEHRLDRLERDARRDGAS